MNELENNDWGYVCPYCLRQYVGTPQQLWNHNIRCEIASLAIKDLGDKGLTQIEMVGLVAIMEKNKEYQEHYVV